jgi:hypothetical protein
VEPCRGTAGKRRLPRASVADRGAGAHVGGEFMASRWLSAAVVIPLAALPAGTLALARAAGPTIAVRRSLASSTALASLTLAKPTLADHDAAPDGSLR